MNYCTFCKNLPADNVHRKYHDNVYGFPIENDNELFGRLILEINQAGLSWDTILKKEPCFREAFANYNIEEIASYDLAKQNELLKNRGIVRNNLKISAVIYNAKKVMELQQNHGSFRNWLDNYHPLTLDEWVRLFKKNFKFMGKQIANEFLMSSGYLKGAHSESCATFVLVKSRRPKWLAYD